MKSTLICFWLNNFTFDANQTKHSFLILMLIAKDEKFNSFWWIKVHNKSSSIECLWCMFSRQQFLISHPCACFWCFFHVLILCWEGLEEDSLQWHWRESYSKQDKESDQGNRERYMQTNALELIHTCKPLETLFLRSISVSPKKEMLTETLWSNMYILLQCARISYWRATLFVISTIMN